MVELKSKKALEKLFQNVETDIDSATGSYLYKGYRIQVSKFKESNSQRVSRLYHKRREAGQCVACGINVNDINPRTKIKYRLCKTHREEIDRK